MLTGLTLSPLAVAGPTEPNATCANDDECGRKAFDAGVQAYQAGDYPTALERFRIAFKHKPHPAVGLNLALAESKSGMLLEAIERFDSVLAHPDASDTLKETATRERKTVVGNLAVLVLEIVGGEGKAPIAATIDGNPISGTPPTAKLNPGSHDLKVSDGDRVLLDRSINLGLGEHLRINVQRSRELVVVPGDPDPKPKPKPPKTEPSTGLDPIWFYAGAGATLVFGAATVWSGLDTKSSFDEYERDLPTLPQSEINQRVDDGNGKETRTNVLLGVTTLAAAGTAVLGIWLVDWGNTSSPERGNVGITPGGVLVRGRF